MTAIIVAMSWSKKISLLDIVTRANWDRQSSDYIQMYVRIQPYTPGYYSGLETCILGYKGVYCIFPNFRSEFSSYVWPHEFIAGTSTPSITDTTGMHIIPLGTSLSVYRCLRIIVGTSVPATKTLQDCSFQ
jgi:hypothetical protein